MLGLALGDCAASALAARMARCESPCLRQLDLRANEISDAGAAQLAEGIELSRSITHLLISDNNITDHGVLAIARAIYRNRSLTVLWLDGASFHVRSAGGSSQRLDMVCCSGHDRKSNVRPGHNGDISGSCCQ